MIKIILLLPIINTPINYPGGNGTQSIVLPKGIAAGMYQLKIISADKTHSSQMVIINP